MSHRLRLVEFTNNSESFLSLARKHNVAINYSLSLNTYGPYYMVNIWRNVIRSLANKLANIRYTIDYSL